MQWGDQEGFGEKVVTDLVPEGKEDSGVPGRSETVQLPGALSCPNPFLGMAQGEEESVHRFMLMTGRASGPSLADQSAVCQAGREYTAHLAGSFLFSAQNQGQVRAQLNSTFIIFLKR